MQIAILLVRCAGTAVKRLCSPLTTAFASGHGFDVVASTSNAFCFQSSGQLNQFQQLSCDE